MTTFFRKRHNVKRKKSLRDSVPMARTLRRILLRDNKLRIWYPYIREDYASFIIDDDVPLSDIHIDCSLKFEIENKTKVKNTYVVVDRGDKGYRIRLKRAVIPFEILSEGFLPFSREGTTYTLQVKCYIDRKQDQLVIAPTEEQIKHIEENFYE